MIKFFRQIRYSLINENRTGKYLKYAIGEIFLVVIGILIALQINNWNEQKALHKKEKQYLTEIRTNLVQDTIRITEVILANKNKMEYIQDVFQKFDVEYSELERRQAMDFPRLGEFDLFNQNNTAYSNLLASASIDLIRNAELKEMLANYYNLDWDYKGNANITKRTRELMEYMSQRFVTKEAIKAAMNIETNLPSIKEYSLNEDAYFVSEFLSLGAIMGSMNQYLIDFKVQNDSLRSKINDYLKKQTF